MDSFQNLNDSLGYVLPTDVRAVMIVFGFFCIPSMLMEICIILLVVCKRQLHRKRYVIVASLMLSNLFTIITSLLSLIVYFAGKINQSVLRVSYISGILILCGISIDRYVAVDKTLRYHEIITKNRMIMFNIICYVVVAIIVACLSINVSLMPFKQRLMIFNLIANIVASIAISVMSWYINKTRKRHIVTIKRRNRHFGRDEERLSLLIQVNQSVKDTFKLSIWSIVLLLSQALFQILSICNIKKDITQFTGIVTGCLILVTNSFVCLFTQKELREATFRFCKKKPNRIGVIG